MSRFLTRLAFATAAILIASVGFVAAVWFLCYAVFLYFETLIDPPLAALVSAVVFVIFGVLVLVSARGLSSMQERSRKRREKERVESILSEIVKTIFGVELATLAEKNPSTTIGVALLLGIALGFSPRLRDALLSLLRR